MKWDRLAVAFLGLFYFGFSDNARGPVYPHALKDLNITSSEGAWLFALSSAAGLAVTLLSRYWLPRYSTITWMKTSWPILAIGLYLIGYSYDINSIIPFYLGSFFQGVGAGILSITMNLIVGQSSDPLKRRKVFGALHGTYGIASLVAPLCYSWLLIQEVHWSSFFKMMSMIPLFLFAVTWKTKGEVPRKLPNRKTKNSKLFQFLFSGMIGLYVASEIVVSSRLVYFLNEGRELDHSSSSLYLSLFFLFLMSGRLSLAFFNIRLKGETILRLSLISSFILLIFGMNGHYIAFSLTGFSMAMFFPCALDCISDWFPEDLDSMIAGAMSGIGICLVFMHLSFGQFTDYYGIQMAMGSSLIFCFISYLFLEVFLNRIKTIRNH